LQQQNKWKMSFIDNLQQTQWKMSFLCSKQTEDELSRLLQQNKWKMSCFLDFAAAKQMEDELLSKDFAAAKQMEDELLSKDFAAANTIWKMN
jgi:hypothetical protein